MEVSMNGLRKRLIADYNSLTRKLNQNCNDEVIEIEAESIRREMEGLRNGLVTLAFTYLEGHFDELDENTRFEQFTDTENVEEE